MKRILFLSNLYPNTASPNRGIFNRLQIESLSSHFDIDVVAPIAWTSGREIASCRARAEGKIRIFHPCYFYTPCLFRTWYGEFLKLSIFPLVSKLIRSHQYSAVFSSWLYPDGWTAVGLADKLNIPCFIKVHGTDVNRLQKGAALSRLSLDALSRANSVICVSNALKAKLIHLGADARRLHVIYNGVDTATFFPVAASTARQKLHLEESLPVILYVGNLKASKGVRELALAFEQIKRTPRLAHAKLVIIGEGSYKGELETLLGKLGVDMDVQLIGSQPHEAVANWMNAANVLCLPSHAEGVPNVILEAICCRRPVVATSVGGIPELAGGGEGLTLVPPKEPASLAAALSKKLCQPGVPSFGFECVSWQENAEMVAKLIGNSL